MKMPLILAMKILWKITENPVTLPWKKSLDFYGFLFSSGCKRPFIQKTAEQKHKKGFTTKSTKEQQARNVDILKLSLYEQTFLEIKLQTDQRAEIYT